MLFTSTSKTIQIAIQIDTARCKGLWHAIPNLAKRYVRHNPHGLGLEQIILAEAALVRLCQTKKPWDPKQIRNIQDQLQSVFELTDDTSDEMKESAKVVLARLFFGCQEYDQVLALLDGLSILNSQSSGYSFVLYYQSMAIKAMSLEMMGEIDACLQLYEHNLRLLDDQQPIKDLTLVEWAEQSLYRANLLISNHSLSVAVNQETWLDFLRSYHKSTCSQPGTWQTERRLEITLLLIKLLSKLNQSGEYIPPTPLDTTALHDQDERKSFAEEMTQLYTICEHMLQSTAITSRTGGSNALMLEMVELLALDMDWIAETTEDWRGYKEVLERASEKTFNSPAILRLFFLTLLRLGEYEEAQHSLQSYLQLVGLVSYENIQTQHDGNAPIQDIYGRYLPLPHHSAQSAIGSTATIKRDYCKTSPHDEHSSNVNGESINQQLNVLMKSIEMFCKDLSKGIKAMEMAELALDLVQSTNTHGLNSKQKSEVYRLSGVAYGLLASQTINSELRPIYHEKALVLLQQANTILPGSWETSYSLAYQHAEMRNIDHAILWVKEALKLNMHYIPSWHLLTLALSCPGQKDHDKAFKIASSGLALWADGMDLPLDYEQHEYYLLLKMTHNRILGTLKGSERKALEQLPSLFQLYIKWKAHGSNNGVMDLSLVEGSLGGEALWYGRHLNGDDNGNDMAPRKPAVYGSLGNISSITSLAHIPHPASSNSTCLAPSTIKSNKSSRPRSASSSTLGRPFFSNNGSDPSNFDSTSMTEASEPTNNGNCNTIHGTPDDSRTTSTLSQRSPTLRKYSSNSMLRVPGSNQSSHHWHGLHLFPSRSASRRTTQIQANHIPPISMIGSTSNESISKKPGVGNEVNVTRYNSEYSIQSGASSGADGGHISPSIVDSFTTTASSTSPTTSLPSLLVPQKQSLHPTARDYLRNQQNHIRLCELWLLAAEWYLAMSQWEEALTAISEAELVCPTHHDVWYLLGKINHNKTQCTTIKGKHDTDVADDKQQHASASAIQYLEKGLLIRPDHVGCQLELAKLYMQQQDFCLAEGILLSTTQGFGWNSAEAWYLLGTIYQHTGRKQLAKVYLFYALELESTCPIQPFSILPRIM